MKSPLVGNDVVDLQLPANQASAANDRFLQRVLTADEYDVVAAAAHPARALWLHWAAKEAAYKSLRRGNVDPRFLHRKFHVRIKEFELFGAGDGRASGTVDHVDDRVDVDWTWCDQWVHCTVAQGDVRAVHDVQPTSLLIADPLADQLLTERTLSDESVAARVLALRLLAKFGVHDARIVRGRRPDGRACAPRVFLADDTQPDVLLSLSHDGGFAAATVASLTPR